MDLSILSYCPQNNIPFVHEHPELARDAIVIGAK